eukprot:NODE_7949_length_540_cov_5.598778_g6903_i0.p2 GENE.NODE_7949_length_540_cov_5.598778_g6903_i0~~NODE_7949_length_540_cov_5.598778_g6903_i0.p2  ORF type:complete len:65 (+),score=0.06 NODE_7949_length_540_cov_5.598778_g6903_i0:154-348(+)
MSAWLHPALSLNVPMLSTSPGVSQPRVCAPATPRLSAFGHDWARVCVHSEHWSQQPDRHDHDHG